MDLPVSLAALIRPTRFGRNPVSGRVDTTIYRCLPLSHSVIAHGGIGWICKDKYFACASDKW